MSDPRAAHGAPAAYRSAQVTSAGPVDQVVLLYQGAIRFGAQHLLALGRGDMEAASRTSIRAQAIVEALQASLNRSAGPIAGQLGQLYDFVMDRLVAGNVAKQPGPTEEALTVLRGLLEAWQALAAPVARPPVAGQAAPGAARPALAATAR